MGARAELGVGVGVALTVVAGLLVSSVYAQAQALVSTVDRLTLGTAHVSGSLSGELTLINQGEQSLRIFAIEPSCGACTEVEFASQDIGPGTRIAVPVRMHSEGDAERHFFGRLHVRSNDPVRPEFDVIQEAHFVPAVGVDRWTTIVEVSPTSELDDEQMPSMSEPIRVRMRVFNWGDATVLSPEADPRGVIANITVGDRLEPGTTVVPSESELSLQIPMSLFSATDGERIARVLLHTGIRTQPIVALTVVLHANESSSWSPPSCSY